MPSPSEPLEVNGCHLWRFPAIADSRGHLTVAEFAAVPFPVRRIFFISDVPANQTRGKDAQITGEKLLLAISGSMLATVEDGTRRQEIMLQHRNVGLVLAPKTWCVVSHFSEGAVLAVLASNPYDEADYIRDYAEFRSIVAGN
jgi:UDP-2-acetamido-3-amino-2,3-dideoxy-glucuronate N-acetyltransferase